MKAEKILNTLKGIKIGQGISWCLYSGDDAQAVEVVKNHINGFFYGGVPFPIKELKGLGIDIITVTVSVDPVKNEYNVSIEGLVVAINQKLERKI